MNHKYLFDVNLNDFLSIFANMRDYVLCFDDLERMDCTIKSVLGFLNTFIEHQKAKTIITCDEDKILNASEKDIYSTYKEKLIKHTYLFVPDMPSVIDSLVAAYSDSTFASFITAHKPLFLTINKNTHSNNIRTIQYSIDICYNLFADILLLVPNIGLQQEVVKFIIALCFESKNRILDKTLLERFVASPSDMMTFAYLKKKEENQEKNKMSTFLETYLFQGYPVIFTSKVLLEYVETGFLHRADIKQAFEKFSHSNQNPEPKYLYKRGYYYKLTNEEFSTSTDYYLDKARKGEIADQNSFLSLFKNMSYYAECELLPVSRTELKSVFLESIELSKAKWKHGDINKAMLVAERENSDFVELYHKVLDLNKELLRRDCSERAIKYLTGPIDELFDRVYSTDTNEWLNPLFSSFPLDGFAKRILKMGSSG